MLGGRRSRNLPCTQCRGSKCACSLKRGDPQDKACDQCIKGKILCSGPTRPEPLPRPREVVDAGIQAPGDLTNSEIPHVKVIDIQLTNPERFYTQTPAKQLNPGVYTSLSTEVMYNYGTVQSDSISLNFSLEGENTLAGPSSQNHNQQSVSPTTFNPMPLQLGDFPEFNFQQSYALPDVWVSMASWNSGNANNN